MVNKFQGTFMSENQVEEKKGWSWLGFFFAPNYYAGYGKFKKGIILSLIQIIPLIGLFINIYAGIKAKKELPIGKQSFNWKLAIGVSFIQFIFIGIIFSIFMSIAFGNLPEDNMQESYITNNPIRYDCSGADAFKGSEFFITLKSDGSTDSNFSGIGFNGWEKQSNGDIFIQPDTEGYYKITHGSVASGLTDVTGKLVAMCFFAE